MGSITPSPDVDAADSGFLDSLSMKSARSHIPPEPDRKHVTYFIDTSLAQIIRADHLIGIRGVNQVKRYQRALTHLENAGVALRLAVATLHLLAKASQN